ncbi:MAG: proline/betaine transporter, partial [Alcaligenes sp.]
IAGLTPTIAAWLVEQTGNLLLPAFYLMFASVIGLVTAMFLPETANRPLRGDTPTASNPDEAEELLQQAYDHIEQNVQDIEAEIAEMEEKLEALKQKRQRL